MESSQENISIFSPENLRRTRAFWIPSVLLVVVAICETTASHHGNLTPWKGGGFGMFSTYDSVDARFPKAYLLTDHGEIPVLVPERLSRDRQIAQTWPDNSRLDQLAEKMTQLYWLRGHGVWAGLESKELRAKYPEYLTLTNRPRQVFSSVKPELYGKEYDQIPVRGVRIEMWRVRMDPSGTILQSELWMSATKSTPRNHSYVQPNTPSVAISKQNSQETEASK